MPSFCRSLYDFACGACNETISLNAHQMKDLLKVGMLAIRQTKRAITSPEKLSLIWKPAVWEELSLKLAASKRFKTSPSLHAMCKQMARISQSPSPTVTTNAGKFDTVATKRKVGRIEGSEEEPTGTNEVKRKKTKSKV
jgi:DNA polymerase phi